MSEVPRIRELPRILLAVLFIAVGIAASLWILWPFLLPLIWSMLVVVATWPLMLMVQKRLWGRRALAVVAMTTALVLVMILPLALAVLTIAEHADDGAKLLRTFVHDGVPPPPVWLDGLPLVGSKLATEWKAAAALSADDLYSRMAPFAREAAGWTLGKAGTLASFFVRVVLMVMISAMLYSKGEAAAAGTRAFAGRLAGSYGTQSITLAGQAIRAVALGVVVTAAVQSVLGGIGLAVLGVPLAGFLTSLMFVLAIAQIGVVPVLALAAAWLYWNGSPVAGAVMLVWTVIVGSLDSIVRPVLIRRGADLPMMLIFAGVIGGLLAFGMLGLFVGPAILAVAYTTLTAWVSEGTVSTISNPSE
jgi:predicted PurR-regulated permease PerM